MASVVAINISKKKGTSKQSIEVGECIADWGIKGDAHAGYWHRQVSFLGKESIDKMAALGIDGLKGGDFAENVTTEGICLYELPIGTQFEINGVLFEVTQIGKECHRHCTIYKKIGDCIMPREGIFATVKRSGTIEAGNEIVVLDRVL